ncbi:ATP-binding protein [Sulfurifustis variabilis]|uniref:ATP-binding protein n=1 Tax=Sulfurifustis variabilis TaxID=1675686 RepID=A0A1B4VA76_9GAMM|nr:DUF2062 domain-containing protein [Sulfurifustis variabilis]BAU48454.1 ATP-binding protein [Sulfurifustis variabilis]
MARRLIKRWFPDPHKVRNHKHLRFFGTLLHDPNLWHLNRHSVSDAFAIGLFMAFVPMPFQMIPAAALAIYLRANLPISVALVWITNPVTMPPISYFCYLVGTWILNTPPQPFAFEPTWDWIAWELKRIWQPFLLGSFVVASLTSLAGYWSMRGLWRWHVIRDWERRKNRPPRVR